MPAAEAARRRYLTELRSASETELVEPATVLGALFVDLASSISGDPHECALGRTIGTAPDVLPPVPEGLRGPGLLGLAHEVLLDEAIRRHSGAFFTAAHIARGLVDHLLETIGPTRPNDQPPSVCDPAVGGAAFLLAAADALAQRGWLPDLIVEDLLWGIDLDPLAVEVTEASLWLWSGQLGQPRRCPHLVSADTLEVGADAFASGPPDGFDLVVGNPPFQNQLGRATARSVEETEVLRARWGRAAGGYVDTAALFLLAAVELTRPGGLAGLIVPQSFLAARDAGPVREALESRAELRSIWIDDEQVFDAEVRVCAPVFEVGPRVSGTRPIERLCGADFRRSDMVDTDPIAWSALLVDPTRTPRVHIDEESALVASVATATAGFRDQYYGLVPFVVEAGDSPDQDDAGSARSARLVTSGLIDPARCGWGERPARFAGRTWEAPLVDLDRLEADASPALAEWARRRLVPKVLVATQTRVVEAAVDVVGCWWPSVPTIAVSPLDRGPSDESDLWLLAAALSAPAVSIWAEANVGGTALSRGAIKLAASQVLNIPLPRDREAWQAGAIAFCEATGAVDAEGWMGALTRFGESMGAAYSVDVAVLDWWIGRLPVWRGAEIAPVSQ